MTKIKTYNFIISTHLAINFEKLPTRKMVMERFFDLLTEDIIDKRGFSVELLDKHSKPIPAIINGKATRRIEKGEKIWLSTEEYEKIYNVEPEVVNS